MCALVCSCRCGWAHAPPPSPTSVISTTLPLTVQRALRRVRQLNKQLNPLCAVYEDEALARARELDLAAGAADAAATTAPTSARTTHSPRPLPLAGVPVVVKDVLDIAGKPTTVGGAEPEAPPATSNAVLLQRLLDAGAVLLGKSNAPAGGMDVQTFNPLYGTTNNPWDPTRTAGGSSGGSACAGARAGNTRHGVQGRYTHLGPQTLTPLFLVSSFSDLQLSL